MPVGRIGVCCGTRARYVCHPSANRRRQMGVGERMKAPTLDTMLQRTYRAHRTYIYTYIQTYIHARTSLPLIIPPPHPGKPTLHHQKTTNPLVRKSKALRDRRISHTDFVFFCFCTVSSLHLPLILDGNSPIHIHVCIHNHKFIILHCFLLVVEFDQSGVTPI